MFRQNRLPCFENYHTLDHIFKLTNIARPVVLRQFLHRSLGNFIQFLLEIFVEMFDKMPHQQFNILLPPAQRRQRNRNYIQTVKQVLTKTPIFHHLFQIFVRGRDDPNINSDIFGTADALKLLFFDKTQQLDLKRLARVTDFVEQDRAVIGQLKNTAFPPFCIGESPHFVTEQLTFEQGVGQRPAIHRHKRIIHARTFVVNGFCDHSFSCSAFTCCENRFCITAGNFLDQIDNFKHLRCLSYDSNMAELGLQRLATC